MIAKHLKETTLNPTFIMKRLRLFDNDVFTKDFMIKMTEPKAIFTSELKYGKITYSKSLEREKNIRFC